MNNRKTNVYSSHILGNGCVTSCYSHAMQDMRKKISSVSTCLVSLIHLQEFDFIYCLH